MHTVPSVRITAHAGTNGGDNTPDSLFTALDTAGDHIVAAQLWLIIILSLVAVGIIFWECVSWERYKRNRWKQFEAWMNRNKRKE